MARYGRGEEGWGSEGRERGWRGGREEGREEDERYRRVWGDPSFSRAGSAAEERREVMEGGDLGWPGGVRGSEGGAGYGRGLFGTAYGLYAGRPEHEPYVRRGHGPERERSPVERAGELRRGRGPKGFRRSDERILDDIVERLMWSGIDAADVEIKVEQGKVTLTGTVAERRDKRRIEDACEDVLGVDDVENHLRVSRKELEEGRGIH